MSNTATDYIQDLYWMYVSLGYPEDSAIALAEEQLEKETAIYESMDDEGTM
jgi:hypothetical protein